MIDVRAYGTLRTTLRTAGGQRQRDEAGEQQGDRKVPLPSLPRGQHASAAERRSSSERPAFAGGAGSTSTTARSAGTTSNDRSASGHANDISDHPPEPGDREDGAERKEEPSGGRERRRHLARLLDAA